MSKTGLKRTTDKLNPRFIYVGTLDYNGYLNSYGIHTVQMDSTNGELTLLDCQEDGCNSTFIAIDSRGKFLYAIDERLDRGSVYTYQIDSETHLLSLKDMLELPAAGCVHNTVSKDDKFILISCWKTSNIISCEIGNDGILTKVVDELNAPKGRSVKERQTQPTPHQIVFDSTGRFALSPDLGTDRVYVILFDNKTGKMTLERHYNVDPGDGPRHLAFHPNNRWVYLLTELENAIYFFSFNAKNGELIRQMKVKLLPEEFLESYVGPEIQGGEIQISGDGRFVFVSMRGYFDEAGNDRIFQLGINPESGSLHTIKSFSSGGVRPRMFELTSDQRFILVCNKTDNEVVSLTYDQASGTIGNVCGRVSIRDAAVVRAVDFPM